MLKGMSMSTGGMRLEKRDKLPPLMDRQDSSIKKAMKGVMKLGRKNRPKMPVIHDR